MLGDIRMHKFLSNREWYVQIEGGELLPTDKMPKEEEETLTKLNKYFEKKRKEFSIYEEGDDEE